MAIDWAATGTMLQGSGTIVGALAVVWAAKKGADTFDSWKRQKIAERKLDQAERILTATYKARQALGFVRSPMMWGNELDAAEEKLKEELEKWDAQPDDRQRRLRTAQAHFNRLNRVKEDRNSLFDCLPMARALFGEELENSVESLHRQFWFVEVDVESYIDDRGEDREFTRKIRRGMYDVKPEGETNEISDATAVAVQTIEAICLPTLHQ